MKPGRWPPDCFRQSMPNCTLPKWYVCENVCALSDPERHLAHVVRLQTRWFVFDATHLNIERLGCRYIGSFVRRQTAMEVAETEVLGYRAPVAIQRGVPDTRLRGLSAALLRQAQRINRLRSVA